MTKIKFTLISALIGLSSIAAAEQQRSGHGAHVHGEATLMLASEGKTLDIQLESPAFNLVGFEHKASTKQEKQAAQKTKTLLSSPDNLFSFEGARCKQEQVSIDMTSVLDEDSKHQSKSKHHEGHAHDDHGHSEKSHSESNHKHEHDDHGHSAKSHKHEHDHHDHSETSHKHEHNDSHGDITANYRFSCDVMPAAVAMSVIWFDIFTGLEEINAMWITEQGQGANTLTSQNRTIRLR